MPRSPRKYGWRRSPEDKRDYKFVPAQVDDEVDLRDHPFMPVVWDQGSLGSCTANAVAAALQFNRALSIGKRARRPSRLDIYYGERQIEGQLGQGDTGAYGRDGFKFAQQTGYLLEKQWPYDISRFEDTPPAGLRIKLRKPYASVEQDVDHIKAALSAEQTVAIGFTVYESFESAQVDNTGIVPMPSPGEQTLGGHEVLIVGYLAAHPNYALVRNSWSTDWGIEGYFLMPWEYITDSDLTGDLRTIVRPAA